MTIITNIEATLPLPLADYLQQLVQQQQYASMHVFVLRRAQLGGMPVQDIWHYSDEAPFGDYYRVFGFTPLDCGILIRYNGDELEATVDTIAAIAV